MNPIDFVGLGENFSVAKGMLLALVSAIVIGGGFMFGMMIYCKRKYP